MAPKKRYEKKKIFTPVFNCCFWIRDLRSGIRDPGWVKIRIRDKHPGSATLVARKWKKFFSLFNLEKVRKYKQVFAKKKGWRVSKTVLKSFSKLHESKFKCPAFYLLLSFPINNLCLRIPTKTPVRNA
jgi:hypothetical protein